LKVESYSFFSHFSYEDILSQQSFYCVCFGDGCGCEIEMLACLQLPECLVDAKRSEED